MLDQGSLASRGKAGSIGPSRRHLLVGVLGTVMISRLKETREREDYDVQGAKQAVGTLFRPDIAACLA